MDDYWHFAPDTQEICMEAQKKGTGPVVRSTIRAVPATGLVPFFRASYLLSTISVTGPLLANSTRIIAPNRPVAVSTPRARTASTNAS
jgi:hypothetical protein